MGFLEPVSIELNERGRTLTPGANWGDVATMTVGYGHGIAVTPLHLASGYATLFNGGIWRPSTLLKIDSRHPGAAGPPGVHRGDVLPDARLAPAGRHRRHRQESRRAGLPGRRQDRHGREDRRRPLYRRRRGHHLRGRLPDGRAALCGRRDARRSQGDRRNLRLPHRRLERRPGRVAGGQPDRRHCSAFSPDERRDVNMAEVLQYVQREGSIDRCASPTSRESAAIPG